MAVPADIITMMPCVIRFHESPVMKPFLFRVFFLLIVAQYSGLATAQDLSLIEHHDPPVSRAFDTKSLTGKVMCGYQGWFNCPGDGATAGWTHWARDRNQPFAPGNVTVDLWPDVSEYGPAERFKTGFELASGSPAEVFSSFNRNTVIRHFQWMKDYGIDGAFVQRFAAGLDNVTFLQHRNTVLANAREGAERAGCAYAVMYDLSGLRKGQVDRVRQDWSALRKRLQFTENSAYLHHQGKPVVAVWGVGFNDDRKYSLVECRDLVRFLKADGCTVMLGVPTGWRDGNRDSTNDPMLHEIIKLADVVSPWSVGRYRTPERASRHGEQVWAADLAWCEDNRLDFLPVVFPGFSWHNLKGEVLDAIPRLKGEFLWSQFVAAKQAGCDMIYVAMFDEVDEGTAIFKCTNDPPVGEDVAFLTYQGLPSDHYLRLTGTGGKMLRGEIPVSKSIPIRQVWYYR